MDFLAFQLLKNRLGLPVQYSWTLAVIQGLAIIGVSFWLQRPPSPGYAIAVLGLVAVIMALRVEEHWGRPEKVVWLVLATGLMVTEILAIKEQDNKHERELSEQARLFREIRAQEQEHFETTMEHFETLQNVSMDLKNIATHLGPSAIAQPRSLQTRGLLLSRGILQWLDARLRGIPQITGPAAEDYRAKTFPLFMQQFGGRIIEIRGEFAERGLNSFVLDALSTPSSQLHSPTPDSSIRGIAEIIERFAMSVRPGPMTPYKDFSEARIAQIATKEADKLDELLKRFNEMSSVRDKTGIPLETYRSMLLSSFNECCRDVIRELHPELLRHVPTAKDESIEFTFNIMMQYSEHGAIEMQLRQYSPWLRKTGIQLKNQAH